MKLYKLDFDRVHLGRSSLGESMNYIYADTLFSALCIEALDMGGEEKLKDLIDFVEVGAIQFTDGMPYVEDSYYIPKPILNVKVQIGLEGDSDAKKAFKHLEYIPIGKLQDYVSGNFLVEDVEETKKEFKLLGSESVMTRVSIEEGIEPTPYQVGIFTFKKEAGLYVLAKENDLFEELLRRLRYTGLGGKRSSGLGRFELDIVDVPKGFEELITEANADQYVSLACCLPREKERKSIIEDERTSYKLIKRSGFVYSDTYADQFVRKKDLYVFAAGSVFGSRFEGDV